MIGTAHVTLPQSKLIYVDALNALFVNVRAVKRRALYLVHKKEMHELQLAGLFKKGVSRLFQEIFK